MKQHCAENITFKGETQNKIGAETRVKKYNQNRLIERKFGNFCKVFENK